MPRALSVITAARRRETGAGPQGKVADTLILPFAQRQAAQKGFLFGTGGACIELDLPEPVRLCTDDALLLDSGDLVEVVAEPEALIEARINDLPALARLAWHLGGRHVPVQVLERRLRLRADPAIEEWLTALGVRVTAIEAPFEPEGDAYEAGHGHHHGHSHDHAHRHAHDHAHAHDHHHHAHVHGNAHDHGDACGCGHDHHHHDHAHHDHAHHDHAHAHRDHAHKHDHGKS
jgi:urease accessory protein